MFANTMISLQVTGRVVVDKAACVVPFMFHHDRIPLKLTVNGEVRYATSFTSSK